MCNLHLKIVRYCKWSMVKKNLNFSVFSLVFSEAEALSCP